MSEGHDDGLTPRITLRVNNDRTGVVIVFGPENEPHYYGTFSPEKALKIAERISAHARSILELRPETQH